MAFQHPHNLWWLLAIPAIIGLYLWSRQPRRIVVATGVLWQRVFPHEGVQSTWWKWRWPVGLALHLGILVLLVLALAGPRFGSPVDTVLVIDVSNSMRADPARLEEAKRLVGAYVEAKGVDERIALLTVGRTLGVVAPLTSDREVLDRAIESAETSPGDSVSRAVETAGRLVGDTTRSRIILFTDACFPDATELAAAGDIELVRLGDSADNVAVTGLAARRLWKEPQTCQVLIEVTSFSGQPVACRLTWTLDDRPIEEVPLDLKPDEPWRRTFEVDSPQGGRITASINIEDIFPRDNQREITLPPVATDPTDGVVGVDLAMDGTTESDGRVDASITTTALPPRRPWAPSWVWLTAVALVAVVVEWGLFQRRRTV